MSEITIDEKTVAGFGEEWRLFPFSVGAEHDLENIFNQYFRLFPWDRLPRGSTGLDLGCGTGRWATFVAPRVGVLHCVEASAEALEVACRNLLAFPNCRLAHATAGNLPYGDNSLDFGYALGVLHHVPDPLRALTDCVAKLRPGAPFLVYVYYALDDRPRWFRSLWAFSDSARRAISKLPIPLRRAVTELIALGAYYPLARLALLLDRRGVDVRNFPLAAYRDRSLYMMRADALDRFGTRFERRFTRAEVVELMRAAGLASVKVSPEPPYWCALGYKPPPHPPR